MVHLIALDWGTTSLRAYLLDATGNILERREGATGTLSYDADGDGGGAAIPFATFTGSPGLAAADFSVV